jgi:large subunit ribosomal protein L14
MTIIQIQTVLPVVDNTGVKSLRCIKVSGRNLKGMAGDFIVGSIFRVRPRLKFRSGHIYRAVIIQTRFPTFRKCGSYIRSLSNRIVLMRKGEDIPIANRTKTYFFLELRLKMLFKITTLTIFLALLSYD